MMGRHRWLPMVLNRTHALARNWRIHLTRKARIELEQTGLALEESDVRDILLGLGTSDFHERCLSRQSDEWMYIFTSDVGGLEIYLKLILRNACVIISFHEDRS